MQARSKDSDVDAEAVRRLLEDVRTGVITTDQAVHRLQRLPFGALDVAKVDHHRTLRQGMVEAIYGPGKTVEACIAIVDELLTQPDGGPVILTRADKAQIAGVMAKFPHGQVSDTTVAWRPRPPRPEKVVVVTAGTADLPVAKECTAVLQSFGFRPELVVDVGVAGLHRLLGEVDRLLEADVVVVVAGMEGALASVVGGIAPGPVIAVPTSVGYGAGLEGVTALLAMMASCAAGVTVVGIDNGFGAAMAVSRMLPHSDVNETKTEHQSLRRSIE